MGFSQGAIGAYRLLMDAYYANEEGPAIDDVYVIGRATTPAERRNVDKALEKFERRGDRYYHKRVEEELAAFRARSKAGTESAEKRWRKDAKGDAKDMPIECQTLSEGDAAEMLASSHKPIPSPSLRSGEGRARKRPKHSLPPDFGLSERVIDWARGKGYDRLPEHLDAFRLKAVANDYRYVDWDHALMNAIEADWAGLRRNGNQPRGQDAVAAAIESLARKEAAGAAH